MADFEITSPTGQRFIVTAPDGASPDEILSYAQANMPKEKDYRALSVPQPVDPTEGMSEGFKFAAGAGKALTDLGRGAAQLVGMGPSAQEMRDIKALDAPLMNTGAGMAGNIAGNVAAFLPAAAAAGPAGLTVGGAGALGATAAAFQPTETPDDRLGNMAAGLGAGAGMQFAAGPMATAMGQRQVTNDFAKSQNAYRDETLRRFQEAGGKLPPSALNNRGLLAWINDQLESVGGKEAVRQEAAIRNDPVVQSLARRAAGLKPDSPITPETLKAARQPIAQPYRDVAGLPPQPLTTAPFPSAAQTLEDLRKARFEANRNFRYYAAHPDPAVQDRALNFQRQAQMLEQTIEAVAKQSGRADLVRDLPRAREALAKNYDVRSAVNMGTGKIDPGVPGRMLDGGKQLTGELETIARANQAFGPFVRDVSGVPAPDVSKMKLLGGAVLGTTGAAAGGAPGVIAGGLPLVSRPVRSMIFSDWYQKLMAQPRY